MKRLYLAVAVLLMLTACGDGTPTRMPTPTLPNAEDLQSALLTLSDLSAGWTSLPDSSSTQLSTLDCGAILPDVRQVAATARFETERGGHLSETIAAFHPGEAEQWLTALQAGTTCTSLNEGENQGTPIAAHVAPLSFPATGDQSFSLKLTTDFGAGRYETDVVCVRVGDFIIQLGTTTVEGADPNLTTSMVQKALDRLRAARL